MVNASGGRGIVSLLMVALLASTLTAAAMYKLERQRTVGGRSRTPELESAPIPSIIVERQVVVQRVEQAIPSGSLDKRADEMAGGRLEMTREEAAAEQSAKMAAAFEHDQPGDAASRKLENQVRQVLMDPNLPGVHLERLECRSTVCRAKSTFDNREADDAAIMRLMMDSNDGHYAIYVPDRIVKENGSISATTYLFGPGSSFLTDQ